MRTNLKFFFYLLSMAYVLKTLNSWFWWESLWIPANCTWADLEDHDGIVFPKPYQLYATIPCAFVMLMVRFLIERYIAIPLAKALGIKNVTRVKPQPNAVLENYFRKCTNHPSQSEMQGLAKKCNWTVHLVDKWFRRRRNLELPTMLRKFQEACWRFSFYLTSSTAGFIFLYDKPWFYDIWQVWVGYPFQSLLSSQYWYYMAEISFYWSLLFTLGTDIKRKDFMAHVVHHLAAIILMACSWCGNYVRIGTLVMIVHDTADFWLESAKMFNYARWEKTCNVLFIIFSVVFFITRIILFPFWILRGTLYLPSYYSSKIVIAYFIFNGQLLILQGLHLYWGYFVLKILNKFLFLKVFRTPTPAWAKTDGKKDLKDDRSDDEEEDSLTDNEECTKNGSKNGCGLNRHQVLNNNH
ncbi:ankyrin repeat and FYVE domain-containing protein 1 [Platysternon megacephalum]|uniref:Ankyrin repeat and FYVE domain-containing protein 1 n=1 Tax=Platysternon megacephalum TaxID=55544 RepID=A0A4D9ERP6_9SAUR|nr:ankyrin repeat and FYVE domain-containing protein 1 [Platysternon megacephalum]